MNIISCVSSIVAKCSSLNSPSNGSVNFSDSMAVYTCQSGYWLSGPEQRLCNNNTAEWTGSEPQCIRELLLHSNTDMETCYYAYTAVVNCSRPPSLDHGFYTLSNGTNLNSVATYSCNRQYVLDGLPTRHCQANDQWSGETPTCRRML